MGTKGEVFSVYIDGASRGNPGEAAIGVLIKAPDGTTLSELSEYIGRATNNEAEYSALIRALDKAGELGVERVVCFTDSELLAKQVAGEYRIREPRLQKLFVAAYNRIGRLKSFRITRIPREKNSEADRLANRALNLRQAMDAAAADTADPE